VTHSGEMKEIDQRMKSKEGKKKSVSGAFDGQTL